LRFAIREALTHGTDPSYGHKSAVRKCARVFTVRGEGDILAGRRACFACAIRSRGRSARRSNGESSDVDVLVTPAPEARWGLDDLLDMKDELEALFGRRVDIVERDVLERSCNRIRKDAILASARTVYVA